MRAPLAPALQAVVLLGEQSAPLSDEGVAAGVDANRLTDIDTSRLRRALSPFLGRPLSRQLISLIEAAIVREYRGQGRPFVEVSTPEQEITRGVLQVRVVQFRLGAVAVQGGAPGEAQRIERSLRLTPGQPIDAEKLGQDLDWLARYPFRTIQPALSPGAAFGQTNLTLTEARQRPWRVYAGYANSGAPATSSDRIFIGGEIGGLLVPDSVLAVQITGAPDFWYANGKPFGRAHPAYESAAARYTLPLAPRQEVEISVNALQTNQAIEAFEERQNVTEISLGYRGALSNLLPLPGDVLAGVEAKRQSRHTFFGDVQVLGATADAFQVYVGWSLQARDPWGASSST